MAVDPNQARYTLRLQDLTDWFAYLQRVTFRRRFRFTLALGILPILVFSLGSFFLYAPDFAFWWRTVTWDPWPYILSILLWALVWIALLFHPRRQARAQAEIQPPSEVLLKWNSAGLEEITANRKERISWSEIKEVIEFRGILLLVRGKTRQAIAAWIVPRHAFADELSYYEFRGLARRQRAVALNPNAEPASSKAPVPAEKSSSRRAWRNPLVWSALGLCLGLLLMAFGAYYWHQAHTPLGHVEKLSTEKVWFPSTVVDGTRLLIQSFDASSQTSSVDVLDLETGRRWTLNLGLGSDFIRSFERNGDLVVDQGRLLSAEGVLDLETDAVQTVTWPAGFRPQALRGVHVYGVGSDTATNDTVVYSVIDLANDARVRSGSLPFPKCQSWSCIHEPTVVAASATHFVVVIPTGEYYWDKDYWLIDSATLQAQLVRLDWHEYLTGDTDKHLIALTEDSLVLAVHQPNGTAGIRVSSLRRGYVETQFSFPERGDLSFLSTDGKQWVLSYDYYLEDDSFTKVSGLMWGNLDADVTGQTEKTMIDVEGPYFAPQWIDDQSFLYTQGENLFVAHPGESALSPWPFLGFGIAVLTGSLLVGIRRLRQLYRLAGLGTIHCPNCGLARKARLPFCGRCGRQATESPE